MDYALTAYPLSLEFRRRLEARLACEPSYLHLGELRRLPPARMLARLRSLRGGRILLPVEDESSRAVLSVLLPVSAVVPQAEILVVEPDLGVTRVARWSAAAGALRFVSASLAGALAALLCALEIRSLRRRPRMVCGRGPGGVLYLKTNLWFGVKAGGSVGHVAGVVNGFIRRGLAVEFASAEQPVMVDRGVALIPLRIPTVFGTPAELNYYRFNRDFERQLLRGGAKSPYGFVYQRLSTANYAGIAVARRLGVPLVVEYNGSEVWAARHWGRALRFQRLALACEAALLRHAHLVVTVSQVLVDELVQERGIAAERVVCYPNCIDPAIFDPARFSAADSARLRERHGIAADALVVTFIGTFGMWHGVERLAGAIAALVDTRAPWLDRHRVMFLLVGDGARRAEAEAILADARYRPYFRMTGLVPQAEAPAYLAASDVLVSPHVPNPDGSRFFGSPTKLFEYMAMAKPIVASDLEQIGEVLADAVRWPADPGAAREEAPRRLAVLTEPGDVQALAGAVAFLVEHPEARDALGRNARREVLARYTWEHHVGAILARLETLA